MQFPEQNYSAPDPLTQPEKCTGIRCSFLIICVFGVLIFVGAALALYWPEVFSILPLSGDGDPLSLPHGSGPPVFH